MFTTPFWPAADSYHIHMMDIPLPDSLSPVALDLIHQATRLAEAACHIHPLSTRTGSALLQSVEEKLSLICFKLAQEFDDPDSRFLHLEAFTRLNSHHRLDKLLRYRTLSCLTAKII